MIEILQDHGFDATLENGEITVHTTKEKLLNTITVLRDDKACEQKILIDMTAVDYLSRNPRFDMVYLLLSPTYNQRLRVKLPIDDDNTTVPSISGLYSAANWYEREVWDMYGISFDGHPDLRRILTDYGFEGHPLRKDFPLTGYQEVRYDIDEKRIVYEPVKLDQAYRTFDFESPWHPELIGKEMKG